MQAGQYLSEFLMSAKRGLKTFDKKDKLAQDTLITSLRKEGVLFVLEDAGNTVSREQFTNTNIQQYGLMRPPYSTTVLAFTADHTEFGPLPHLVIALDRPEEECVMVAHSFKTVHKAHEHTPDWTAPIFFWRIYYDGRSFMRDEEGIWVTNMRPYSLAHQAFKELRSTYPQYSDDEFYHLLAEQGVFSINAYLKFCVALHDNEVTFTDVVPDKKANQMRRARGKAPLFTYKTLTIGGPKQQGHGKGGGTHASPRSHLRRGHYRTLKSGKRIWINSFMVIGNGEGFVHKDYKVVGVEA